MKIQSAIKYVNPYLPYIKIAAISLIAASLYSCGYNSAREKYKSKLDAKIATIESERVAMIKKTAESERVMQNDFIKKSNEYEQQLEKSRSEIDALRADVRAGRVHIKSTACAPRNNPPVTGNSGMDFKPKPNTGDAETEVAESVIDIADYGLAAMKQRDACVALLKSERETLNGKEIKND